MTHPAVIKDELSRYPYDPEKCTEVIDVEFSDEDFCILATMAHERDITLNHLICALLDQEIRRREKEQADVEG